MKKLLIILPFLLCFIKLEAQDPHFSQFFASPLTLNPAQTGNFNGILRVATNYRNQWPTLGKAYTTSTASLDGSFFTNSLSEGNKVSGGLLMLSDQSGNGILKENHLGLSIAYTKGLDEDGRNSLSIGFQGSYSRLAFDFEKARFEDQLSTSGFNLPTAEILLGQDIGKSYLDLHAGVLYQGSIGENGGYYLGGSIYHLRKPNIGLNSTQYRMGQRFNIQGGGYLPIGELSTLHFSSQYQHQLNYKEWIWGAAISRNLVNTANTYKELYLGSWIRNNDAIIPYAGFEWNDLRVGFSYDITVDKKRSAAISYQSAEVSVTWILQEKKSTYQKRCPKF